jgi:outer membrane protein TolC
MGLPAADVLEIPSAADKFPPTTPFDLDPAISDRLASLARRNRADLAASALREASAQRALEAAENARKARLDLSFRGGYRGLDEGNDIGPFLGALSNNVPGLSASVGLRYELPHKNTAARGLAVRRRALREQQRILREDLDRRLTSAVRVAALALANSLEQASYIESAVSLSRATVENEKEKYGLGFATLFDVIQAEDNLRAALLSEIDIRLAHALALAGLRFETGTMSAPDDLPAARAEWFTIPPQP